jgi:phosphatidyl-myo-inositol dimannoside synthase
MAANIPIRSDHRIIALFPELRGVGGIQEAGRLTAAALTEIASAHNYALDCLSLNDSPGRLTFPSANGNVPFFGFGRAKARFVLAAISRVRRGSRLVLAAHPHLAVPAALLKLFQPRLKLAVISHGVEAWHRLPPLRRRAFLKSDVFLAPSRYTVDQVVEIQGAPRNKTRQLPWPLNPYIMRLAEQRDALPRPDGFPRGLVILTIARLMRNESYKGVDQLIRAVAELAPKLAAVHLVVVASGDDLPRHRELAADLAVASQVHFFEDLSADQVAACYSRCDVFALPSTGEGFGFVFLEAMAFGKPVIGAAAGGATDIVEDGVNGLLVPAGDFDQLVRSLERLLLSESLRTELGRKGTERVSSKYQFEIFRRGLERVLLDCGLESRVSQ